MMGQYRIIGNLDYVQGHLRYGHFELYVDKEIWDGMSEKEQEEYMRDHGDLIVDDWSIEDYGDIYEIVKEDI